MPQTPTEFQASYGEPLKIVVTADDGQDYQLAVQVVVMAVRQIVGQLAPDGNPAFNIDAQIAVHTSVKV